MKPIAYILLLGIAGVLTTAMVDAQGPKPVPRSSETNKTTAAAPNAPEEEPQPAGNKFAVPPPPPERVKVLAPAPVVDPVAPASSDEPTNPNIVLDCPPSGTVGTIVVVSAARSTNIRKLKWVIVPAVAFYPDPRLNPNPREIVFATRTDGIYAVTVKASSPDGGLDERTESIQIGEAVAPVGPADKFKAASPRGPTDYVQYIRNLAKEITGTNRKGDCLAMAGCFSSAAGLLQTGGIRSRDELFRATDTLIEKALGSDLESCTSFLTELLHETASERDDLGRLLEVWQQIATGLAQASR